MPKALGRNLHSCFSVVVTKRPNLLPPPLSPDHHHHHHHHHSRPNLFKNYNSLYEEASAADDLSRPPSPPPLLSPSPSTSTTTSSEPDFATVFASDRFFFSSPGRSNSIVDSSSGGSTADQELLPPGRGIAVPTYSPDPYRDFRQSMQEMVDATRGRGGLVDVGSSWDYLHELLLSYLALNPKNTHKFIVCAFADLLVNLLSSSAETRGDGGALIERDPPGRCGAGGCGGNKVQLT